MNMCSFYHVIYVADFPDGPGPVNFKPLLPGKLVEGEHLNVSCAAECIPPCSYDWTLGQLVVATGQQLTLPNISRSHMGNVYTCTAKNVVGEKSRSNQFKMTVYCECCIVM